MPICIECRHPVKTLWTQYSGAGDPSSGHNIRLTVCKNCGRFCDKYVEHDFVKQLARGTLPKECFLHFIKSVAHFSADFARNCL